MLVAQQMLSYVSAVRRSDKEITDRAVIDEIIASCDVCRLALAMDNRPYLIPISFGYDGRSIFIHTAGAGKKIEYFESNPHVCFEFERSVRLFPDDRSPCKWAFSFQSVVGYGTIREVTEVDGKTKALNEIMRHYSKRDWLFTPEMAGSVRIWRIEIESLTGKQSNDKSP